MATWLLPHSPHIWRPQCQWVAKGPWGPLPQPSPCRCVTHKGTGIMGSQCPPGQQPTMSPSEREGARSWANARWPSGSCREGLGKEPHLFLTPEPPAPGKSCREPEGPVPTGWSTPVPKRTACRMGQVGPQVGQDMAFPSSSFKELDTTPGQR